MAVKTANLKAVFTTSIGRKLVMAATGLFLVSFLVVHLTGNLLLLKNDGGAAFNEYSEFMETSPLIRIAELGLLAGFLFHIIWGLMLASKNSAARPKRYKVNRAGENSSFYSRFMVYSGLSVLIFLFLHLWHFMFKHRFGTPGETMYDTAVELFSNPVYSIGYLAAMVLLSFHLSHGFQSAFQSLGLQVSKRLTARVQAICWMLSVLICAGFATIPLYFLITA